MANYSGARFKRFRDALESFQATVEAGEVTEYKDGGMGARNRPAIWNTAVDDLLNTG
jgi:hypothetical protein